MRLSSRVSPNLARKRAKLKRRFRVSGSSAWRGEYGRSLSHASMALRYNEGKACDAVIRVLEAREGKSRDNVRLPEKECHAAPIEFACNIGDRLFVLEHTGIEPFPGHMQMEAEADRLFAPIGTLLAGKLPPDDTFELGIPVNALHGLKKKGLAQIQTALIAWVESTAPTVPVAPYARYLRSIQKVQPPGVPFEVRLDRFQSIVQPGRFQIKHSIADEDLEPARGTRIRVACEKKFPKLEAWHQDALARTVLVLEDNDIQLTNPQCVFDTLAALRHDCTNWPDEIYLVSTIIKNPWYVHALQVGDRQYCELSEAGQCLTEFDADRLIDVTGRRP
jgi:hypothetical protein